MIEKAYSCSRTIGDITLKATISPCSWMHPDNGLQIQVQMLPVGGTAYLNDQSKPFNDFTEADMAAMLGTVKIVPCSRCGNPAFDPATVRTNLAGKCHPCLMADRDQEAKAFQERAAKRQKSKDEEMKGKGMTHRVMAMVHPDAGGDDYPVVFYADTEPTEAQIKKQLKKMGSAVLDDFSIHKI